MPPMRAWQTRTQDPPSLELNDFEETRSSLDRKTVDSLTALLLSSSMAGDLEFEWHYAKARSNYAKHGVTFDNAQKAFSDPFMVEVLDDTEDYGEERFLLIGMVDGELLSVIYTPRRGRYRLISARHSTKDEQDHYFTQNSRGPA